MGEYRRMKFVTASRKWRSRTLLVLATTGAALTAPRMEASVATLPLTFLRCNLAPRQTFSSVSLLSSVSIASVRVRWATTIG